MSALTNSGVKVGKKVTYYGDKEKLIKAANNALNDRGSDIQGLKVNQGTSVVDAAPSQTAAAAPMVDPRLRQPRHINPADDIQQEAAPDIHTEGGDISVQSNKAPVPTISKPSIYEATHDENGLEKPINGAETKLGKLLHIVFASARGTAAGAGARTFGEGYSRAQQLPISLAENRMQVNRGGADLQHTNLQNEELQQSIDEHPETLDLQHKLLNSQITENQAQTETSKAHGEYWRNAVEKLKQGALNNVNNLYELAIARATEKDPVKKAALDEAFKSVMEYHTALKKQGGASGMLTKKQSADIEKWKANQYAALNKLQGDRKKRLSPDVLATTKQQIEDGYAAMLSAATGKQIESYKYGNQPPSTSGDSGEFETQSYQGHTYRRRKGSGDQWQLSQ